jgi:hypothetical protein
VRRETQAERAAWTELVDGTKPEKGNKYGARREGKYASKHEAAMAATLKILAARGTIRDLREQVRITLVSGNGKLRPVVYVADFTYLDSDSKLHVLDAKGFKTPVYRLKKRLAALLLGIEIEEV